MVVGGGPSRIRDWDEALTLFLDQVIALDGPDQDEGKKATLQTLVTFLSQYIGGDGGGGGGGGTTTLINTGSGAGVYSSMSGTVAQLRSLRSTTSALAITQGTTEISFSIGNATASNNGLMSINDKLKLDGLPNSIPVATSGQSGLMANTDKVKLDGLPGSIGLASSEQPGLMSIEDKTKLDGLPDTVETVQLASVGTGAAVYSGKTAGIDQIRSLKSNSPPLTVAASGNEINFSIATVTGGSAGLMTAADKTKLDGIPPGGGGGGGGDEDPLPALVDFTINNNSATTINLSSEAPLGTWLVLCDANDPMFSCLVVADFAHGSVGFYSNPGGGIDIVAVYSLFNPMTGVLTGSTGPVGKFNISVTTDFQIHLENRTGTNRIMRYFQTGGGSGGGAVSLGQLIDVDLTGLANNHVLTYDQALGKWVPRTGGTGGGGGSGDYPRSANFDDITIGDELAGNRVSHTYDTDDGLYQITAVQGANSSVFEISAGGGLAFNGVSLAPALELTATLNQCKAYRDETIAARDVAEDFSDLARRWASDPVGSPISGGAQSSYAYSQIALQTALSSRILPSKIIVDADIVSGKYTLKSGDLFLILAFRNTVACQLVCPPNLWRNSKGEAWVMIRREGALVTVVNMTGAVTSPLYKASRSLLRRFPTGLASQIDITEVLNIGTMTNGKIMVMCHSVHQTTGTKNLSFLSPTSGIPTPTVVWSDSGFVGATEHMKQNQWEFAIASFAGGDVSFRLTLPVGCLGAIANITAIDNAGTREDNTPVKSAGVQSNISTGSTTTNGQSRFTLASFAQRSNTALPAIVSGGMFQDIISSTVGTGIATGDDGDRFGNLGSVSAYEIVPEIANRNYGCQFNAADGPTSVLYCAYPPFSTASVASTVRSANGDPTIANADGVGMLHASPDGLTYFFNAG